MLMSSMLKYSTIRKELLVMTSLFAIAILLSANSSSVVLSKQTKDISVEPTSKILNIFCFVIVEEGYWTRVNFFIYAFIELLVRFIEKYEWLAKIVFSILNKLTDKYFEFQSIIPLRVYHSTTLVCTTWKGTITTIGLFGIVEKEKSKSYSPMFIVLCGFTGVWIKKDKADFAFGFAKCVVLA